MANLLQRYVNSLPIPGIRPGLPQRTHPSVDEKSSDMIWCLILLPFMLDPETAPAIAQNGKQKEVSYWLA